MLGIAAMGALVLGGCASALPVAVDAAGTPIPIEALVGVRVEGSVTLTSTEGERCYEAAYDAGTGLVTSPFVTPEGYAKQDVVMADPMNPGSDLPNPALINLDGEPVGFSGTRSIVTARFVATDDPTIASVAAECGFDGAVLVADSPAGITVDPDGIETFARTCREPSGVEGQPEDPVSAPDLSTCTTSPIPHPTASVG